MLVLIYSRCVNSHLKSYPVWRYPPLLTVEADWRSWNRTAITFLLKYIYENLLFIHFSCRFIVYFLSAIPRRMEKRSTLEPALHVTDDQYISGFKTRNEKEQASRKAGVVRVKIPAKIINFGAFLKLITCILPSSSWTVHLHGQESGSAVPLSKQTFQTSARFPIQPVIHRRK